MGSSIWSSRLTSRTDEAAVVFVDNIEVGVVAAQGVRFGVDVLDVEVRLAVGEHAGEVDFADLGVGQEIAEELDLWVGVEAVGVQVEALFDFGFVVDVGEADGFVGFGGDLVVALLWFADEFDGVFFGFVGLVDFVEGVEEAWDDDVVEEFVELVDVGQDGVDAFFDGVVDDVFDGEARFVEVADDLGDQSEGGEGAALAGVTVRSATVMRARRSASARERPSWVVWVTRYLVVSMPLRDSSVSWYWYECQKKSGSPAHLVNRIRYLTG